MNPSLEQIGIFIAIVVMLIPAIDTVKRWASGGDKSIISPQPLQIALEKEFATKDELQKLEDKFVGGVAQIQSSINAYNHAAEKRASSIHTRVDRILGGMQLIRGRCQILHGEFPKALEHDEET